MTDIDQMTVDSTLNVLQQDLESADSAVAMAIIEQWENHLQETELFEPLSQLKQAILNGNTAHVPELLHRLAELSSTSNPVVRDRIPDEMEAQVAQISELLSQAANNAK
jgi:hypothetical protein